MAAMTNEELQVSLAFEDSDTDSDGDNNDDTRKKDIEGLSDMWHTIGPEHDGMVQKSDIRKMLHIFINHFFVDVSGKHSTRLHDIARKQLEQIQGNLNFNQFVNIIRALEAEIKKTWRMVKLGRKWLKNKKRLKSAYENAPPVSSITNKLQKKKEELKFTDYVSHLTEHLLPIAPNVIGTLRETYHLTQPQARTKWIGILEEAVEELRGSQLPLFIKKPFTRQPAHVAHQVAVISRDKVLREMLQGKYKLTPRQAYDIIFSAKKKIKADRSKLFHAKNKIKADRGKFFPNGNSNYSSNSDGEEDRGEEKSESKTGSHGGTAALTAARAAAQTAQETPSRSVMNSFRTAFVQIWDAIVATGNPDVTYGQQAMRFVNAILSRALQNHMTHATPGQIRDVVGDISNMLVNGNRNFFPGPISYDKFMHLIKQSDRILQSNFDVEDPFYMGRIASGYTQAIINDGQGTSSSSNQQETSNAQIARKLQEQFLRRTERLDRRDAEKMQQQEQERRRQEQEMRRQRLQEQEERRRLQEQQQRATNEQIARNHELALRLQGEGGMAKNPSPVPPRGRNRSRGRASNQQETSKAQMARLKQIDSQLARRMQERWRKKKGKCWQYFGQNEQGRRTSRGESKTSTTPPRGTRSDLPPIVIVVGEDGFPFLNDLIPGTGYTFRELRRAIGPTKSGAREAQKRSSLAVHKVFENMVDAPLAYRILNEFAENHSQWNQHRNYNARQILNLLRTTLIQFTRTSDRIYSNPHAIDAIVRKGSGAIVNGVNIRIGDRNIDSATFVLLMIFFIGQFPPAFQKRWAENYIRDNIEAYTGAPKLETFLPGARCSSCPKGIVERMFYGLFNELNFARERVIDHNAVRKHQEFNEEAAKRAEEAAERDRIAAAEEAERARFRHADGRRAMVQEWTMRHYMDQEEQGKEMNAKGLREYLQSRISSNSDYENTQTEWDQSMHNYFTDEMLNGLSVERGGKSWENISKRNNEVKEGGRRKKRKKTRKGKKKKNRKKTRKGKKKKNRKKTRKAGKKK